MSCANDADAVIVEHVADVVGRHRPGGRADHAEPPDIDLDIEHDRREEVIRHVYEKYGRDRAAMAAVASTTPERRELNAEGPGGSSWSMMR